MDFKDLGLSEDILSAIEFTQATQIQEKTIPVLLTGSDVIAQSATGSGKTFAFGAPLIQNIQKGKAAQALILTPTRELAQQVSKELTKFARNKKLNVACIYGGVAMNPQTAALRHCEIIVATPGRLLDHISRRSANLSRVKVLVLDEADLMLDMGFIDDITDIIKECPATRQTVLFSATFPHKIEELARKYMIKPTKIIVKEHIDPSLLSQVYYEVAEKVKSSALIFLLKKDTPTATIVFCNTQRMTDAVARTLQKEGFKTLAIHGGLSQSKRTNILDMFHKKKIDILVCTDVASRGLDIKGVSHIYNFDIPRNEKEYTHRIGRTARAGKSGSACSLVSKRDRGDFNYILKNFQQKITRGDLPQFDKVELVRESEEPRSDFGGRRDNSRHSSYGRGNSSRSFDRPRFGDRKPFGERRPFNERRSFGEKRLFEKESEPSSLSSEAAPQRSFSGHSGLNERRESTGFQKRNFERKEGESKPAGVKKPSPILKKYFAGKNAWKKEGQSSEPKKPFGEHKPATEKKKEELIFDDEQ